MKIEYDVDDGFEHVFKSKKFPFVILTLAEVTVDDPMMKITTYNPKKDRDEIVVTILTEDERARWKLEGNQRVEEVLEDHAFYRMHAAKMIFHVKNPGGKLDSHLALNSYWEKQMLKEKHGQ